MIATPKEIQAENKPKMKRIASLDFQRGLAIWMMVFLHVFNRIWDFSGVGLDDLFATLNFGLSLLMVIMAFFGGFAGYFILISSVVNSLATTKSALKGTSPGKLLFKRILTGVGILLAGRITETFGYYGYFGRVLRSGNSILQASTWTDSFALSFFWRRIFMMEALQIIGWCQIITGIIAFFLIRNGGTKKFVRNIIIYSGLAAAILVATPFMWNWIDNLNWPNLPSMELITNWDLPDAAYHNTWPSEALQSENASFLTYICVILTGDLYPIFPFLATSFIGSAWGLLLAKPKPSKRLPLYGGLITLGIFVIGAVLNIILGFNLNLQRPPMQYFFLLLGAQFGIMILLLWLVEYRGKAQKFGNNIIVKYFRLWGTIALSVFSLQIWSLVPRAILNPLFGINLMNEKFELLTGGWWVLMFAVLTILCYDLLFWLWAQINFIFSFEWFIIRLGSIPTKSVSKRLNVKEILHEVEWMDYQKMSQ
ncbi:MAG: hypothetical protein KAS47_03960 [Candidatus Heimdallarchaeota archaeon]|nr:hypothetical protein [Candidatus Heimdallarchaeota archaeon]